MKNTTGRPVFSTGTQTLALFSTIKGTACNKDRARVWIESDKLAQYGFTRGAPITVLFCADYISVELDDTGKRKVAGRERGGRTICILDICCEAWLRTEMFNGAPTLDVFARHGLLIIKAHK
jgi:hypothetical protein